MAVVHYLGFIVRVDHPRRVLVVFIVIQNLVGIDAVVSIICEILSFASLAWKYLFPPTFGGYWGILSCKWRNINEIRRCIDRQKWSTDAKCVCVCVCVWRIGQKERQRKKFYYCKLHGYSPNIPTSSDRSEVLHGLYSSRLNFFKYHQNRLSGFGDGGSKLALSHFFGHWLLQQLVQPCKQLWLRSGRFSFFAPQVRHIATVG